MPTSDINKAYILADLWLNYRSDDEFKDFIEYNDLGLPLAYMIANNIVSITDLAQKFIDETFDLFLAAVELEDDGFENLDEILEMGLTDL